MCFRLFFQANAAAAVTAIRPWGSSGFPPGSQPQTSPQPQVWETLANPDPRVQSWADPEWTSCQKQPKQVPANSTSAPHISKPPLPGPLGEELPWLRGRGCGPPLGAPVLCAAGAGSAEQGLGERGSVSQDLADSGSGESNVVLDLPVAPGALSEQLGFSHPGPLPPRGWQIYTTQVDGDLNKTVPAAACRSPPTSPGPPQTSTK